MGCTGALVHPDLTSSGSARKTSKRRATHPDLYVPLRVLGLFWPHYVSWSEQQKIEFHAPEYLRNVIRIITETGLRVYKELTPMKKEQLDLENRTVWIPDSKTANGWLKFR